MADKGVVVFTAGCSGCVCILALIGLGIVAILFALAAKIIM